MDALGVEAAVFYGDIKKPKSGTQASKQEVGTGFFGHMEKIFSTVSSSLVEKTYQSENIWNKKIQSEALRERHEEDEEEEESLSSLYKQYRGLLIKLYKLRSMLEPGGESI